MSSELNFDVVPPIGDVAFDGKDRFARAHRAMARPGIDHPPGGVSAK
jgi:hypothetical protein